MAGRFDMSRAASGAVVGVVVGIISVVMDESQMWWLAVPVFALINGSVGDHPGDDSSSSPTWSGSDSGGGESGGSSDSGGGGGGDGD